MRGARESLERILVWNWPVQHVVSPGGSFTQQGQQENRGDPECKPCR
jgi:hypothetical protein